MGRVRGAGEGHRLRRQRYIDGSPTPPLPPNPQIVHKQLLTVRAELGAHHSYGTFRSATELLECAGHAALASADEEALRQWALRRVLGALRDAEGAPLPLPDERGLAALAKRQRWGMCRAMNRRVWPKLLGLDLGEGRAGVASVEAPAGSLAAELLAEVRTVGGRATKAAVDAVCRAAEAAQAGVDGWGMAARAVLGSSWALEGHGGDVRSVCVSGDGAFIVTGSGDTTARVRAMLPDGR